MASLPHTTSPVGSVGLEGNTRRWFLLTEGLKTWVKISPLLILLWQNRLKQRIHFGHFLPHLTTDIEASVVVQRDIMIGWNEMTQYMAA